MIICTLFICFQVRANESDTKISQTYMEEIFKNVTENMNPDESTVARYISPLYQQDVDGHKLDYKGFFQHMVKQKSMVDSVKLTIQHFISEGNKACTVHRVDAVKKNGEKLVVKVVAYFEFDSSGKLILCDELTHVLEGSKEDRNLGSVK